MGVDGVHAGRWTRTGWPPTGRGRGERRRVTGTPRGRSRAARSTAGRSPGPAATASRRNGRRRGRRTGWRPPARPAYTRAELVAFPEARAIGTRRFFAGNLTRQPAYARYRVAGSLENSDTVTEHTFWIGVHPRLGLEHGGHDDVVVSRQAGDPEHVRVLLHGGPYGAVRQLVAQVGSACGCRGGRVATVGTVRVRHSTAQHGTARQRALPARQRSAVRETRNAPPPSGSEGARRLTGSRGGSAGRCRRVRSGARRRRG